MSDVLFVAVSQSAVPPIWSIRSLPPWPRRADAGVTNAIDSPLADAAEIAVDVRAGAERAVAATKSYTAELLSLYLLFAGEHAAQDASSCRRRRLERWRSRPTIGSRRSRRRCNMPSGWC